jgi:hypothetical protein
MDRPSTRILVRRDFGAALAVVALSFLALFVPIIVYAFVLAFRARGAPNQAAINQFAAAISPRLMPWLERILTFFLAFWVVRRSEAAHAIDGLLVGVLSGLLGLGVTLAFGGRLTLHSLLAFLVLSGLGALGGFLGQKMSPARTTSI